jgi:hypothetical protein
MTLSPNRVLQDVADHSNGAAVASEETKTDDASAAARPVAPSESLLRASKAADTYARSRAQTFQLGALLFES